MVCVREWTGETWREGVLCFGPWTLTDACPAARNQATAFFIASAQPRLTGRFIISCRFLDTLRHLCAAFNLFQKVFRPRKPNAPCKERFKRVRV